MNYVRLERHEAIVLTGTFSELYVIQCDVPCVASTPCTFKHNLKQSNAKLLTSHRRAENSQYISPRISFNLVCQNVVVRQDKREPQVLQVIPLHDTLTRLKRDDRIISKLQGNLQMQPHTTSLSIPVGNKKQWFLIFLPYIVIQNGM